VVACALLIMRLAASTSFPCAPAADSLPPWITVDSAAHRVTLALEAQPGGPDGIATLNGHHHGDLQVVVPLGWNVTWAWVNRDSAAHSLVVMVEREKLPLEGGRPSFDNALSRSVVTGLKPAQKDQTTFTVDQVGWYWVLCGVPGHAIRGEWIGLKVDQKAQGVKVVKKE
jgi:hypothetical protein